MRITEPTAFISTGALRHNVRHLLERVAPAALLAVVKDDAYGHGVDTVVDVLLAEGITRFGTLDLTGALALRRRTVESTVFAWVFDRGDDLEEAVRAGIDIGVTDAPTLERVASAARAVALGPARVHLKLDTGLHRAGALLKDWDGFVSRAAELQRAETVTVAGLWTHLAEESDDDDSRSIAEYCEAVETARAHGIRGAVRHIAASAAAYARSDARFDMVRIGAFLYGIAPGSGIGPAELGLRPVMTLRAPVTATMRASDALAEVGVGGAAGILADAAGSVTVAIGGVRYPVAAVEPHRILIDVGASEVPAGTVVTLFGDGDSGEPTLQEWADAMGTIGEEIVTRLAASITRVVIQ